MISSAPANGCYWRVRSSSRDLASTLCGPRFWGTEPYAEICENLLQMAEHFFMLGYQQIYSSHEVSEYYRQLVVISCAHVIADCRKNRRCLSGAVLNGVAQRRMASTHLCPCHVMWWMTSLLLTAAMLTRYYGSTQCGLEDVSGWRAKDAWRPLPRQAEVPAAKTCGASSATQVEKPHGTCDWRTSGGDSFARWSEAVCASPRKTPSAMQNVTSDRAERDHRQSTRHSRSNHDPSSPLACLLT